MSDRLFKDFYKESIFTHISDQEIFLKQVVNTNKCFIHLKKHKNKLLVTSTIDNLLKGGAPMSPQIARKVITHFNDQAPQKNPDSMLTDREQDIVNGLVDGLSYKLIADRFSISIDTVRAHIRNIYKKLHVNSKAEVIAKSLRGEI